MNIKEEKMDTNLNYGNYYIAFLDMLGFKNLINSSSCQQILEVFDKVRYPIKARSTDSSNSVKKFEIKNKIISDSICLYIEANTIENLFLLLFSCSIIQWELLKLDTPVFIRGGIVCGELYSDGDVIFGPGLTKAYLMEEQNAKYPRVIVTNETLSILRTKYPEQQIEQVAFKDFDRFYTVNYFSRISDLGVREKVEKYVNHILDTTIDMSLREKYLYVSDKLKHLE